MKWQVIEDADKHYAQMERLLVPTGWLVRVIDSVPREYTDGRFEDGYQWRTSLVFVPDPTHDWII